MEHTTLATGMKATNENTTETSDSGKLRIDIISNQSLNNVVLGLHYDYGGSFDSEILFNGYARSHKRPLLAKQS